MKTDRVETSEILTLNEAVLRLKECEMKNKAFEVSYKELQAEYSELNEERHELLLYSEKIIEVKKIVEKNQFPIFTAFALDLEFNSRTTLEEFVKLKSLLGIKNGVNESAAIKYDKFKSTRPNEYRQIMDTLDARIYHMKSEKSDWYGYSTSSTYMFMSAMYVTHINKLSEDMSLEEVDRILLNIDSYNFTSG